MEVPITVYSSVNAQYTMSANEVCDSTEVTFTNTSSSFTGGHPATYLWDFGDGTTSSLAEPAHVFRNVTGSPIDYNIRLTVTTANGCTDFFERTLRVHPYVKAEFTVKEVAGCSPFITEVQTTTYAGNATYSWDFGAAGTDNVAQPGAKTYSLTTGGSQVNTISLTVADASGMCQDQMSIPVEVYSSVVSDFTVTPSEGCNPLDVELQSTSDAWAQNLTWQFGDGSSASATGAGDKQTHRYFNSQATDQVYTATLQVETAHGCEHSSTNDITVYPFVLADFSINKAQGCSPLEVTVDNRSSGGNYRIFWDDTNLAGPADETHSSQGTTTHTYTNSSGSSQTHQLTIIADNGAGCYDTLKRTITVHSSIDAQFAMDVDEGCTPLDVDFTNNTQFANSYQWTFGDGASSNMASPQHRYENLELNDQSFDVKMIAESPFGCIDSITQTVDVWSYVKANFSVEDNEGCPPFDVVFENTSVGNAADTYSWSIDGVAEATAPTNRDDFAYQFDNSTVTVRDYQITLVATNVHGCTQEKTDVISVYENVTADFNLSSVGECTPMEMVYEDLSSVPGNTNYFWEFGDGATSGSQEPTHTFYNTSRTDDRQFTTKLKVVSQHYCEDSIAKDFIVYHQPKAQFDIDNTSSCPPLEVNLKNKSLGADQFIWRLGDGSERSNIEELSWSYDNTANSVRDYELELWTSTIHGCTDSASLMLNVFPRVEAAFSYDTSGCSPFVSSFINTSLNADYYYWEFDDGNTSSQQDPIHRFSNTTDADKVYDVYMRASSEYNCVDEVTNQVTAFAQPIAEFNVDPIVQRFPEKRVFISDASNAGPWSYQWTLGDGQNENGDINYHDYEHWGDYDITLSLNSTTSPCSDAVTRSVSILPPLIDARFSTDRVDGCAPLTVEFEAAASFYNENYTYEWDFGDGTTGTGATPTHVYDQYGTFMVKLTAKGEGGSDYAYRKITVYQVPVAQFELAPKVSMLNEDMQARVEYYNLSSCGDTLGCDYLWTFGDGTTSTDKDAVYHYEELGKYDVSLRVTSSKGCVDEFTMPKGVEVIGEGVMKFPNAFVPSTEGPNGGYYNTPDYKNQVFHPVAKGVIDYRLVIYNRWGEIVFETKDIEVGWDGYIDGKLAKQDVYVYKATGKFTNGEPFEIVGDVTVIQ
jgi:PKD repeat protein